MPSCNLRPVLVLKIGVRVVQLFCVCNGYFWIAFTQLFYSLNNPVLYFLCAFDMTSSSYLETVKL